MTLASEALSRADIEARIAAVPLWYHSIEVAPGLVTPGWFDLRDSVDRLPWPDVAGRRCLDVGTSDGFLALELERRGAAEVVAVDIASHDDWDWEHHLHRDGPAYVRHVSGPEPGIGFRTAHELLGSSVRRVAASVYDLSPDELGSFDVVVCGSLLLHLRDPFRALAAIRSVCAGELLLTNQIELGLSVVARRRPLARIDGTAGLAQWWLPNAAGQRQLARAAGFGILADSGPYAVAYGPRHPPRATGVRGRLRASLERRVLGGEGVPHLALRLVPEDPPAPAGALAPPPS